MASTPHLAAPILHVLEDLTLPRLVANIWNHTIVARPERRLLRLPQGVNAVPLKLHGRRTVVHQTKLFDRATFLSARWPEDAMRELRTPKLMIVADGRTGFRVADYVLQCSTGTAIFIPPGIPHTDGNTSHLETLPPEYTRCSLLWFSPMVSGIACRMCHCRGEVHHTGGKGERIFLHNPRLLQLFWLLAEEADQMHTRERYGAIPDGNTFGHLFLAFLQLVVRDINNGRFLNQGVPVHEDQSGRHEDDTIEQAIQYINTHFASPMNLDDISRRFLMSRAQFTRKFRQRTGQSFLEFVNARRIDQAKKLLTETEWTSAIIGRYIGLQSAPSFHRLFVRCVGCTPMEFRENHGAEK